MPCVQRAAISERTGARGVHGGEYVYARARERGSHTRVRASDARCVLRRARAAGTDGGAKATTYGGGRMCGRGDGARRSDDHRWGDAGLSRIAALCAGFPAFIHVRARSTSPCQLCAHLARACSAPRVLASSFVQFCSFLVCRCERTVRHVRLGRPGSPALAVVYLVAVRPPRVETRMTTDDRARERPCASVGSAQEFQEPSVVQAQLAVEPRRIRQPRAATTQTEASTPQAAAHAPQPQASRSPFAARLGTTNPPLLPDSPAVETDRCYRHPPLPHPVQPRTNPRPTPGGAPAISGFGHNVIGAPGWKPPHRQRGAVPIPLAPTAPPRTHQAGRAHCARTRVSPGRCPRALRQGRACRWVHAAGCLRPLRTPRGLGWGLGLSLSEKLA